ncbi:ABC transporter substrate-binding protein [Thalassotalea sp. M1531]|uniref:ABC transporter substrate-binding protein n=1 Tax=Thalassotalea algicola TaxID=2716224 RepID=A0A7Y0LE29_9GAMM|nr:CmpA/NrtA family ABC transporter substrate-binding protein [Thalassotalea algicola]NMP32457.1 ABC transporter substrate-binding protein [Thalassotalea algicola]
MIKESQPRYLVEKSDINIGFMPLADCAPLAVALEQGYFKEQGLNVTLKKQYSWATMRDKLHAGVLDAAQLLAPMPLASSLGINGEKHQVIAPMVLSQNGNAITLSMALYEEVKAFNKLTTLDIPLSAGLLKPIIKARKSVGQKLTFATVYPHSCHYYQLCSWFEHNNIAIDDVEILIITPVNMVEALRSEDIDGFCVGGPWNAKAVRDGVGVTCVTSCDIWPNIPEKVLGMLADWQKSYPETTKALIYALRKACNWLSNVANRFEAARLLSQHQYLDLHLSVIAPSLIGSCLVHHQQSPRHVPSYNQFSSEGAECINRPDHFKGEWLLSHMCKVGQVSSDKLSKNIVAEVFRQDIYQQTFAPKFLVSDIDETTTDIAEQA